MGLKHHSGRPTFVGLPVRLLARNTLNCRAFVGLFFLILFLGGCATAHPPQEFVASASGASAAPAPKTKPHKAAPPHKMHGGAAAPQHMPEHAGVLPGALILPGGQPIGIKDAALNLRELTRADYVLLGEGHTVACDHLAQVDMLRILVNAGRHPVVGLEMVATDKQPVLDRFNAGELTVAELRQALDWDNNWRHDYLVYEPIFTFLKDNQVPAYALNAPPEVVRKVSRTGVDSLDQAERAYLPERIIPPSDDQTASLELEFERHKAMFAKGGEVEEKKRKAMQDAMAGRIRRFFTIQSLWDTAMAENAARVHRTTLRPVAILAGGGHVEHGWGIEHRLSRVDPGAEVYSVYPWRGGGLPKQEADLFFFCPQTRRSRLGFTVEWRAGAGPVPGRAVVLGVMPGTPADKAGIATGDIILRAEDMDVDDLWILHKAGVAARSTDGILDLAVDRGGEEVGIQLDVSKSPGSPGGHTD